MEAMQSDLYNFFERKFESFFANIKKWCTFAPVFKKTDALLAQLVEQLTLNQWVQGSSP